MSRVPKTHPRIEAYGTVDELNAHIGLTLTVARPARASTREWLRHVQNDLFDVGADISAPEDPERERLRVLPAQTDMARAALRRGQRDAQAAEVVRPAGRHRRRRASARLPDRVPAGGAARDRAAATTSARRSSGTSTGCRTCCSSSAGGPTAAMSRCGSRGATGRRLAYGVIARPRQAATNETAHRGGGARSGSSVRGRGRDPSGSAPTASSSDGRSRALSDVRAISTRTQESAADRVRCRALWPFGRAVCVMVATGACVRGHERRGRGSASLPSSPSMRPRSVAAAGAGLNEPPPPAAPPRATPESRHRDRSRAQIPSSEASPRPATTRSPRCT